MGVAKDKPQRSNVTAFQLDETVEAPPDGMSVPPLPGLWKNGQPVSVDALGMTVTEVRDVLAELSLPIEEVHVPESRTLKEFPPPPGHLRSEANVGHPLAMGPGYGDADLTAQPDPTLVEQSVEQLHELQDEAAERAEVTGQEAK